jgi:hypothetical protein
MLKRLAILGGGALIVAVILVGVYYQQRNAVGEGYDIKCVQPSEPTSATNSLACKIYPSNNAEQGNASPPWWDKLLAWPEGITAWLLMLTLGAVCWQSWEMRKSAKASLAQIRLTTEKERARLYVRPGILESFKDRGTEKWALRVRLEVENSGNSRAYGIGREIDGRGCIWVQGVSAPIVPRLTLPWIGSARYVSEGTFNTTLDSQLLSVIPDTIEEALYGDQAIFLQGFVRYETLGKRFCKRYGYRWWTGSFDRTGLNFGNKFIEGRWLEDDEQDNSETEISQKPN